VAVLTRAGQDRAAGLHLRRVAAARDRIRG
jgi:hypothetical protein